MFDTIDYNITINFAQLNLCPTYCIINIYISL